MAADTRPYKSKEQDGQGNELIIRDQQLVEQDTTTTMPAGTCFQTLDVDGRPVKIPKANMVDIVREALGTLLNGLSDQTTVTKVPSLNGNTLGASTVATLASVLGVFGVTFKYATTDDFNHIDDVKGNYCVGLGNPPASWGCPIEYGALMAFCSGGYYFQLLFTHKEFYSIYGIKYRMNNGETWGEWKTIALT